MIAVRRQREEESTEKEKNEKEKILFQQSM